MALLLPYGKMIREAELNGEQSGYLLEGVREGVAK